LKRSLKFGAAFSTLSKDAVLRDDLRGPHRAAAGRGPEVSLSILCSRERVCKTAGETILARNGVIRNIVNMGIIQLPSKMKSFGETYYQGHYFLIRFYSSPYVLQDIGKVFKLDPRLIRYHFVKLGTKYVA
jgi:ribosomal protein S6